jgi:uncharacterized protein
MPASKGIEGCMRHSRRIEMLENLVREVYQDSRDKVPYHGWHHVSYVVKKAASFSAELDANVELVIAASLVHDLNYVASGSSDETGATLRQWVLTSAGFDTQSMTLIKGIVMDASTSRRNGNISNEAKALSDGDTAYKALPVAPLLSLLYIRETGSKLKELAEKIVREQGPLMEHGIYFYSRQAHAEHINDALANLSLWRRVLDSFANEDIQFMIPELGI